MSQKLSRRAARANAFKAAFASTFGLNEEGARWEIPFDLEDCELDDFARSLLEQLSLHKDEIDEKISSHLKGWTLQRLPRVSLTILRSALSEILYGEEKLTGVAINEAVELAKEYGDEGDYQFVNGILGAIVRELPDAEAAASQE